MKNSILLILLILTFPCLVKAQNPNDTIQMDQFNVSYLEQLVAENIITRRKLNRLDSLKHHSILKKAADDQAKYVVSAGKITHKQDEANKATAKLRVVYFGGTNMRGVAENIAAVTILRLVKIKTLSGLDSILHIQTYKQAADVLTGMWFISPPHYKNLTNEAFKYSGISVSIDPKTYMLYVVQVFGYQ